MAQFTKRFFFFLAFSFSKVLSVNTGCKRLAERNKCSRVLRGRGKKSWQVHTNKCPLRFQALSRATLFLLLAQGRAEHERREFVRARRKGSSSGTARAESFSLKKKGGFVFNQGKAAAADFFSSRFQATPSTYTCSLSAPPPALADLSGKTPRGGRSSDEVLSSSSSVSAASFRLPPPSREDELPLLLAAAAAAAAATGSASTHASRGRASLLLACATTSKVHPFGSGRSAPPAAAGKPAFSCSPSPSAPLPFPIPSPARCSLRRAERRAASTSSGSTEARISAWTWCL